MHIINMISIIPVSTTKFRALGWVQDPSNLVSLCDVVAIFDKNSKKYKELIEKSIPTLVKSEDGQTKLLNALNAEPLKIKYNDLVGTAFIPRSASRCNGIIQAAIKGQIRSFIGDWPADNFLRWAHCFGFVKYNYYDDTFEITQNGLKLTAARTTATNNLSTKEKELLINAILAYPPAIRILSLLYEDKSNHLTKFELGKNLGFIGEEGFTSMPQNILIRALCNTDSNKEKNKMKTDWEGSSDKYARMIATWLEKLGLVEKVEKNVCASMFGKIYNETIGHAYTITPNGIKCLRIATGKSKHKRIAKNVFWEMFATKGTDRDYLRTRRAIILKILSESKGGINSDQIIIRLNNFGLNERKETVLDDINGLINIGINIIIKNNKYYFDDYINDFIIPKPENLIKSDFFKIKDDVRYSLKLLSHDYLSLIDLAYDSSQNRLFEMKTMELLTQEFEFNGLHLGGSRKPDGIIYTTELLKNYGVIIDTKAYSNGYNLPISQADEMERYIAENQVRDENINSNKWWENFGDDISDFYFMFISGHFKGKYQEQIRRISLNKKIPGIAMKIIDLLLLTERYKNNEIDHQKFKEIFYNNASLIN